MDIRWQGQTTFEIATGDSRVIFDPFPGSPGPTPGWEGSLVITSSRPDLERIDPNGIDPAAFILKGPGEYEIGGLALKGIPTPRSEEGTDRAINTVFVLETEGLSICHAGQLRDPMSSQTRQALGAIDILILPAGGQGTIGPEEAASIIRQLDPKIVLPVYGGAEPGAQSEDALKRMISEIGVEAGDPIPRLNVTRSNLPPEMRVVLLRPTAR
ncbi:MAG: MBL fold metallo-hydrolase [Chloroflexi bacterium]|nr:MBL fold metallo-hydrolase [Chloroflexota bacterium]